MIGEFTYNPPDVPLDVIHVDDEILIVNKPSGLLSVPGRPVEHQDCLQNRARAAFPTSLQVHRLDMDTSGVMVFAMNPKAQRHIGLQFERRKTDKTYQALVWGHIDAAGEVNLPLIVDWPNRPLQMVCHDRGKPAHTRWECLSKGQDSSRVRLFPTTGRSHQLRVHMLAIGHPVLGDRFYATGATLAANKRLCLHAEMLEIHHPSDGRRVRFAADCPF